MKKKKDIVYDYVIVGGGIIGLSIAYKLSLKDEQSSILVLEKEKDLALHQTGRNSGVIHSGIYYKPNSFKLKNCIEGRRQLVDFAKVNNISFEMCGKLIVATKEKELPVLNKIYENGLRNGLSLIKLLNEKQSKFYEPKVKCLKSIFVPYAGIINYVGVVKKMEELLNAKNNYNKVIKSNKIIKIKDTDTYKELYTKDLYFKGKYVIFACGLQADEMAILDGIDLKSRIIGFRGDYYNVVKSGKSKVKSLIYPVPNIDLPFLGVHLTKMYDSSVEAGPNAVLSFKKEGYSKTSFSFEDTFKMVFYIGFWKLIKTYWKLGLKEYARAFSKTAFLNSLRVLVPNLKKEDLITGKIGVRAQALDVNGNLIDDFLIKKTKNSLHVINAPSPAATASLAIADEVLNRIKENE
ncbi:L-2-hydroxyglutarate oxidase [Xanthomarina gelatinilytica]|uniref:L-2-hydroxyglutarate oxidase n=1 Tax=Xanthomarina gelatinilytica TaxID=1137281 RepID=UPI003AA9B5F8